ncbi:unnamed protein product [Calicophoron daubneyi]|uniref:MTP large subunit lipid-binding domain-containing protein n=1 Tax=Calicophoron daubneyi TaxID=300641 RepID=A0AAV2TP49_CALDB
MITGYCSCDFNYLVPKLSFLRFERLTVMGSADLERRETRWLCVILLAVLVDFAFGSEDLHQTYEYLYSANLTIQTKTERILKYVSKNVVVSDYLLGEWRNPTPDTSGSGRKLMHMEFSDVENERPAQTTQAVAEFDVTGAFERMYVPILPALKTTELNLIKGIVSMFVTNRYLKPGLELDSSGLCQVSYLQLDKNGLVVLKNKTGCQRTHKAVDVWNYDLLPSPKPEDRQISIKYHFEKDKEHLISSVLREEDIISWFPGGKLSNIRLLLYQDLLLLKKYRGKRSESGLNTKRFSPADVEEIAQKLTGSPNKDMQLSLLFPPAPETLACTLNSQLLDGIENQHPVGKDMFAVLSQAIEDAKESLQGSKLGQFSSAFRSLQLMRLLRCLPNDQGVGELLATIPNLMPNSSDPQSVVSQDDGWQDQLTDVLIGCGTPICLSVVVERIEQLSRIAIIEVAKPKPMKKSIKVARKLLFSRLWPSLAHLNKPSSSIFTHLFSLCKPVTSSFEKTICLTTMTNLISRCAHVEGTVRAEMMEIIAEYLTVREADSIQSSSGQNADQNSRLLTGISLADKIHNVRFIEPLFNIIRNSHLVSSLVESSAFRTLARILGSLGGSVTGELGLGIQSQLRDLRTLLTDRIVATPLDLEADLMAAQEAFDTLILLKTPTVWLAGILKALSEQGRWSLLCACRQLIAQACEIHLIHDEDCGCLGDPRFANRSVKCTLDLGKASGWSSDAPNNASEAGQVTNIRGNLLSVSNSTLTGDYSLKLITGTSGELCLSKLDVSMTNEKRRTKLLDFSILGSGLDNLMFSTSDRGSERMGGREAWVGLELTYLDTMLPPWKVFSGGYGAVIELLWSMSSTAVPVLQVLRTIVDRRDYFTLSAGFVVRTDVTGLLSLEVSGAMSTSFFSQSGNSLVRNRLAVAAEAHTRLIDECEDDGAGTDHVYGLGGESTVDFVTVIKVAELPEGICMSMMRKDGTQFLSWEVAELASNIPHIDHHDLNGNHYTIVANLTFPGESYDLGLTNSKRCTKIAKNLIWEED